MFREIIYSVAAFLVGLGGFGLFLLATLDSSFLFAPLGMDVLLVYLSARYPSRLLYYVAISTAGSVLGIYLVDIVCRKGGEAGLEKYLPPGRRDYIKRRVTDRAGYVVALASLLPPPFPFTIFIIGASALQYPRKKLLLITAGTRFLRYLITGILAIIFGSAILELAEHPAVEWGVVGLILASITGSILSVRSWIKRSRKAG